MLRKRSNCLFFALRLYYRRKRKGKHGYVISRQSNYGWFPHFMYQYTYRGRLKQVGYIPKNPKVKFLPPPLFSGKIKFGDQ